MRYTTLFACVFVVAVSLTGNPAAAQISHMGQDITDHVVLRDGALSGRDPIVCNSASFNNRGLFRVAPDGTLAADPFTVPAGRLLVITDVEWSVSATTTGLPLTPGWTVRTRVQIGNGTTVFLSRMIEVGAQGAPVYGSEQLTTGFVVASNTPICPGAAELQSNTVISAKLLEMVLRGYLIDTK